MSKIIRCKVFSVIEAHDRPVKIGVKMWLVEVLKPFLSPGGRDGRSLEWRRRRRVEFIKLCLCCKTAPWQNFKRKRSELKRSWRKSFNAWIIPKNYLTDPTLPCYAKLSTHCPNACSRSWFLRWADTDRTCWVIRSSFIWIYNGI